MMSTLKTNTSPRDNGTLIPPEETVVAAVAGRPTGESSLFDRVTLEAIVEDKLHGTSKSGLNKEQLKPFVVVIAEVPVGAFTHTINGVQHALVRHRSGKFEIALEDVGKTVEHILVNHIMDWYDKEGIEFMKRSPVDFFSSWFSKRYTPGAKVVQNSLVNAGFTPAKVKQLVKECHADSLAGTQTEHGALRLIQLPKHQAWQEPTKGREVATLNGELSDKVKPLRT